MVSYKVSKKKIRKKIQNFRFGVNPETEKCSVCSGIYETRYLTDDLVCPNCHHERSPEQTGTLQPIYKSPQKSQPPSQPQSGLSSPRLPILQRTFSTDHIKSVNRKLSLLTVDDITANKREQLPVPPTIVAKLDTSKVSNLYQKRPSYDTMEMVRRSRARSDNSERRNNSNGAISGRTSITTGRTESEEDLLRNISNLQKQVKIAYADTDDPHVLEYLETQGKTSAVLLQSESNPCNLASYKGLYSEDKQHDVLVKALIPFLAFGCGYYLSIRLVQRPFFSPLDFFNQLSNVPQKSGIGKFWSHEDERAAFIEYIQKQHKLYYENTPEEDRDMIEDIDIQSMDYKLNQQFELDKLFRKLGPFFYKYLYYWTLETIKPIPQIEEINTLDNKFFNKIIKHVLDGPGNGLLEFNRSYTYSNPQLCDLYETIRGPVMKAWVENFKLAPTCEKQLAKLSSKLSATNAQLEKTSRELKSVRTRSERSSRGYSMTPPDNKVYVLDPKKLENTEQYKNIMELLSRKESLTPSELSTINRYFTSREFYEVPNPQSQQQQQQMYQHLLGPRQRGSDDFLRARIMRDGGYGGYGGNTPYNFSESSSPSLNFDFMRFGKKAKKAKKSIKKIRKH